MNTSNSYYRIKKRDNTYIKLPHSVMECVLREIWRNVIKKELFILPVLATKASCLYGTMTTLRADNQRIILCNHDGIAYIQTTANQIFIADISACNDGSVCTSFGFFDSQALDTLLKNASKYAKKEKGVFLWE